jgi:hypothetical protein
VEQEYRPEVQLIIRSTQYSTDQEYMLGVQLIYQKYRPGVQHINKKYRPGVQLGQEYSWLIRNAGWKYS